MFGSQRGYIIFLAAAGAVGTFIGHANPFFQWPPAVLLAPACLYLLATLELSPRQTFFAGWLTGLSGQSAALYWLTIPMHGVGALPYLLAIPAVLLLGAYLGCWYGVACLAMRAVRQRLRMEARPGMPARVLAPLAGGAVFGGCEVLMGVLFTGFPWLTLSTAFAPWSAWIQGAHIFGAYGLSALYGAAGCALAAALAGQKRLLPALLGLCLLVILPAYGLERLQAAATATPSLENAITVGMVQGNIDQNQKWEPAYQQATLTRYLTLSQTLLEQQNKEHPERPVSLILWPETAMPFYFRDNDARTAQLRSFAVEHAVGIGFGILGYRQRGKDFSLFNRFALLDAAGRTAGVYDKQHLVPFGEYVPLKLDLSFLSSMLQGMTFSSGSEEKPLRLPLRESPRPDAEQSRITAPQPDPQPGPVAPSLALGVLICYEAIFPELAQARVEQGATVLANISNDAWFGRSSAPAQHLHLAAMRAVEQFRPIVRATNTGITAAISPRGEITRYGTLFEAATAVATVRPESSLTLYHRLHPWVEIFLVVCTVLTLLAAFLRKPRNPV